MIDLRSDTVTQPTDKMRRAMMDAIVGDDVYDDDPTVKVLEATAAKLLGKEAALFVPSGTFGNQLCILTHTRRGDEIIVGHDSHILYHEVGAASVIAGVQLRTIESFGGRFDIKKLKSLIREDDIHYPDTGLICIENAHGNGSVIPVEKMAEIYAVGKAHSVPVHLDGARIFNAAAALGVPVDVLCQYADTVTFCLSKGLCAPVGSIVAGDEAFIKKAKKNRKLMGGGLRQVGFLAAAGLVALEEMVVRLKDDHELAKYMADELDKIDGLSVIRERLDINMVFFTLEEGLIEEKDLISGLFEAGIKVNGVEDGEWRFVTNHDVSRPDIDKTITYMKQLLKP